MKRSSGLQAAVTAAAIVIFVALGVYLAVGTVKMGQSYQRGAAEDLESALRRAATACYAIEGAYPPTVEYLTGKYGVTVDSSRFAVFYEVFAENLMPEISVKEK